MSITIEEALECVEDSLFHLNQLYHLHAVSQESLSDEGITMLQLAVSHAITPFRESEQLSLESLSLESTIGNWIKVAWNKIIEAIEYIWNMIKQLFQVADDEKEAKKAKMRQDKVKDILKTAGHNVKFDEVGYLDSSLADHFAYSKYNLIDNNGLMERLTALKPVIPYLGTVGTASLQTQDFVAKSISDVIKQGGTLEQLALTIMSCIEEAIGSLNYYATIDRSVYPELQIDSKSINVGASGYLDVLLGNRKLYILHMQPVNGFEHYALKVATDPQIKAHDVKVPYLKAHELGMYTDALNSINHELLTVQDSLIKQTSVAHKTSKDAIAAIQALFIQHPEQAEDILQSAQLFLKATIQPFFNTLACFKQLKRDLSVYNAIQEAHIKHYQI